MDAIAKDDAIPPLWGPVVERLAGEIRRRGAHPARTVVLLPYAQLMPVARRAWARFAGNGFAPRFQTTMNWARESAFVPGEADIAFDTARDLLAARRWLREGGLAAEADALAPRLVEAATQAAAAARACAPADRTAWAARVRTAIAQGFEAPGLAVEGRLAAIAIEWAAASAQASDSLLADPPGADLFTQPLEGVDLLVELRGWQPDPLAEAVAARLGDRAIAWPLAEGPSEFGDVSLHAARDPGDEAERAAACVLRHLAQGRRVAVVATDRVVTRQLQAMLACRDVPIRDETGWKLSTLRAAAGLRAALVAGAWDASTDAVLDWLRQGSAVPPLRVRTLERRVRQLGLRDWGVVRPEDWGSGEGMQASRGEVAAWREGLRAPRPLLDWLSALRELLRATGQWRALDLDAGGQLVLRALRLLPGGDADLQALSAARGAMDLRAFTAWCDAVLESQSYAADFVSDAPVVLLPLPQLLGQHFDAVVIPGCDDAHLPLAPEPPRPWTAAQRALLGLPGREDLQAAQAAAWQHALGFAHVDLLWHASDAQGETVLPSPLVELARRHGQTQVAQDPRSPQPQAPRPAARPAPGGAGALVPSVLSATSYDDLRRCPYRFFALRMLGLQDPAELDAEVDKRDFGTWLHEVLHRFHERCRDEGEPPDRAALLDEVAAATRVGLRIEEGEFLPFEAAWPAVRSGYLAWLAEHEAAGARFAEAEAQRKGTVGAWTLDGRLDRIDRRGDGWLVIDYKTESLETTKQRVAMPLEDTQLGFYGLLLGADQAEAGYLNIAERGEVKFVAHPDLDATTRELARALPAELGRVAAGAPLPALGEGRACEFCSARGLCRKDQWDA